MPVISVDSCGETGLIQDIYPQEMAPNAWSRAKNFVFREGFAEKVSGHAAAYGVPEISPYHLVNFLSAYGNMWVYAGLGKIYAVDSNFQHANITRQTLGVDVDYSTDVLDKWNSGVLSGVVILNNGEDIPQYWAGNGRATDLSNWPINDRCKVLRPFRNYLLALNVTKSGVNYPHLVKWSHHADPGTLPSSWDVTDATKDAGEYDLADDQTELVDGLAMGEQFICYKRSGYYGVQYIGAPFIFRFQKISGLYGGALSVNCVTEFPGGHFVLGSGDVYIHQGGPPESVIDARNRKWLFKQLNSDYRDRAFTAALPLSNELYVCFPQQGDDLCTLALVWNWKYNTWGVKELPGVMHAGTGSVNYEGGKLWSTIQENWPGTALSWEQNLSTNAVTTAMFASPQNERLYAFSVGNVADTTPYESYVLRDNIRFDKPDTVKLVKQVRPLIEGPVGSSIDIWISAAYDQTADPQWFGPYPFTIGAQQKIDCHVIGRMLGVKFTATGDFTWRLKRYDLIVQEIGMY